MKRLFILFFGIFIISSHVGFAQHEFTGYVDTQNSSEDIYLSLVEDYRKISGIYPEQIIQKVTSDSTGYFSFKGDQLPIENHIYRIQVHECFEKNESSIHFNGFCPDSKEVLFIANRSDTISLPFSFDREMFCKIVSGNEKSNAFIRIDSIIEEMQFVFGNYRSQTNRKINAARWLTKLQQFGEELNEPLAELYIYSFLSDKSNELYQHYLKDLKKTEYYDQLLTRLQKKYPNSSYLKQYQQELDSDKFLIDPKKGITGSLWFWAIISILLLSLFLNIFQFSKHRKKKKSSNISLEKKLTQQEQKILNLILADKTNKEIASSIFVSISTVKTHINNLYKKLNVSSRDEVKSLYNNR
ncbi:helix-turn-helix transcriptional regulator [Aquimarina sp. 2201CG5-10]|uniref:helix-turn-helix transcriptional regulator n=1 Tax=Aquimarina callyspongiae TaxID=3098150 RepID=UPI002AB3AEE3|nr:helix-turn-helix transcriptional regulator [Aquimarina sp. 2201CG5-10]MDY8136417.1 helix-turn-helix transcriptional regulator [Aquimarina sp. 2201CG5-10]